MTRLIEDRINRIPDYYLCSKHGQRLGSFSGQRWCTHPLSRLFGANGDGHQISLAEIAVAFSR